MDRERYKNLRRKIQPQIRKRSINNEERPVVEQQPATASQPITPLPEPTTPKAQPAVPKAKQPKSLPELFDEDDEDIFGVWKNQKEIKKAEKAERAAAKAAKKSAKKARKEALKAVNGTETSTIAISVPSVSKVKRTARNLYNPKYKKRYIAGGALLVVPILVIATGVIVSINHNNQKTTDVLGDKTTAVAKPDFSTLKPTNSENQATDLKYDQEKKVASYNDVLDDVKITVSQQPLPSSFTGEPASKVEDLAKQMNATDKISAGSVTAYSGMSIKGPQTVIFTKNDLLIFIIADRKIDTLKWSDYIENMQ